MTVAIEPVGVEEDVTYLWAGGRAAAEAAACTCLEDVGSTQARRSSCKWRPATGAAAARTARTHRRVRSESLENTLNINLASAHPFNGSDK